jgi:hypothetical protein
MKDRNKNYEHDDPLSRGNVTRLMHVNEKGDFNEE